MVHKHSIIMCIDCVVLRLMQLLLTNFIHCNEERVDGKYGNTNGVIT